MGACLRVNQLLSVNGSRREKLCHLFAILFLRIVTMLPNPDGGQLSLFFTGAPTDSTGGFPNWLKKMVKIMLARYLLRRAQMKLFAGVQYAQESSSCGCASRRFASLGVGSAGG